MRSNWRNLQNLCWNSLWLDLRKTSIKIINWTALSKLWYLLKNLDYNILQWIICVNLKMVSFLLGQQSGYTEYSFFLCMLDSRARNKNKKHWPESSRLQVGTANVTNEPFSSQGENCLPFVAEVRVDGSLCQSFKQGRRFLQVLLQSIYRTCTWKAFLKSSGFVCWWEIPIL